MKFGLRSSSKRRLDKASTVSWSFPAKKNYSSPLFLLNQPDSSPIPYSSLHSAFLSPLDPPLWIQLRISTKARLQPSPPPHRKCGRAGNSPGNDPFPRQDNTPGEVVRPPWVTQSPFRCRWLVPRGQTCPGCDGCGIKNNSVCCS